MSMVRIKIDPNMQTREGLTKARVNWADGFIAAGDVVEAFEPEDGIRFPARVLSMDDKYVLLDVDWDAIEDDDVADYWQGSTPVGPLWGNRSSSLTWSANTPGQLEGMPELTHSGSRAA